MAADLFNSSPKVEFSLDDAAAAASRALNHFSLRNKKEQLGEHDYFWLYLVILASKNQSKELRLFAADVLASGFCSWCSLPGDWYKTRTNVLNCHGYFADCLSTIYDSLPPEGYVLKGNNIIIKKGFEDLTNKCLMPLRRLVAQQMVDNTFKHIEETDSKHPSQFLDQLQTIRDQITIKTGNTVRTLQEYCSAAYKEEIIEKPETFTAGSISISNPPKKEEICTLLKPYYPKEGTKILNESRFMEPGSKGWCRCPLKQSYCWVHRTVHDSSGNTPVVMYQSHTGVLKLSCFRKRGKNENPITLFDPSVAAKL